MPDRKKKLQKEKATNGHTNPPPSQSKPQTTTTPIQTTKSEHLNIQIPRSTIQNRSPHPPENHMPKKPIKDYKNP